MHVHSTYPKMVPSLEYSIFSWFGKCAVFIVIYCDTHWATEDEVETLGRVTLSYYYSTSTKAVKKKVTHSFHLKITLHGTKELLHSLKSKGQDINFPLWKWWPCSTEPVTNRTEWSRGKKGYIDWIMEKEGNSTPLQNYLPRWAATINCHVVVSWWNPWFDLFAPYRAFVVITGFEISS